MLPIADLNARIVVFFYGIITVGNVYPEIGDKGVGTFYIMSL